MSTASRVLLFFGAALFFSANNDALAAEDILSVDKTLIIQIIIFVAAIFILNSLLFKPLLELLGRREKLTSGTIEEAKQLGEKVEQIINEYKMKLNEARSLAMEERNEIRRHAQTAYEDAVKKAREEAQAVMEESKVRLQSETKEIKEKVRSDIAVLARDMVSRILGKEI
ncbi:MAG: ATP synthase F0 subunit B [Thermodesulfobacteriota bacterium]